MSVVFRNASTANPVSEKTPSEFSAKRIFLLWLCKDMEQECLPPNLTDALRSFYIDSHDYSP